MSTSNERKKLYIKSFGCQMNVYDATRMADVMAAEGYVQTGTPEDADLVLLNTCHIREKAAEKVYSDLGRLKRMSDRRTEAGGRKMTIGVAGCVAQAEGAEIFARQPAVDLVVGPQAYHNLPQMVREAKHGRPLDIDFPVEAKFGALPQVRRQTRSPSAFVTVQEGCDKFCAFCVVPYTRGAEYSRPAIAVLDEVRALADEGVREISFLGQNVNAYHGEGPEGDEWSLARLMLEAAKLPAIRRIRYTTSHPSDMRDDLIEAHAEPKVMPYLHLPVQSGSDAILKAMNRKHGRESYVRLIERFRNVRPDMAISGDFITGFPGETAADFEDTMTLVHEIKYAQAYSFKYSPRPGTPAAGAEQIAEEVKAERLARLQELLNIQQKDFLDQQVGTIQPVLIEKPGRLEGQLVGKSPHLISTHIKGDEEMIGQIVDVSITESWRNTLAGEKTPA